MFHHGVGRRTANIRPQAACPNVMYVTHTLALVAQLRILVHVEDHGAPVAQKKADEGLA
jgi:hypothetical protein